MLSFAMNPRILQIITILTKGGEEDGEDDKEYWLYKEG